MPSPPPDRESDPLRRENAPALDELIALLDLDSVGEGTFRGDSPKDRWQRVFGGQVLGQALVAAQRTVEARICHSLHGYFLRAGDPRTPILYRVENSRDGGSFSARRVTALQKDEVIFTMSASFHVPEEGLVHQIPMPEVPQPETLRSEREWRDEAAAQWPEAVRSWFLRERPVEFRPVSPENRFSGEKRPAAQTLWMRAKGYLGDSPALHQCVLAYASDMTLLDTSLLPHGHSLFTPSLQLASLDHAMWFHRAFRADEWLLYVQDSPVAAQARSFNRGSIFQRDGCTGRSRASAQRIGLRRKISSPCVRLWPHAAGANRNYRTR